MTRCSNFFVHNWDAADLFAGNGVNVRSKFIDLVELLALASELDYIIIKDGSREIVCSFIEKQQK